MLIAVLGGTSSGKTSLVSELCKKGFQKIISVTTREKRDGEKDGVDCYFVSKKDFLRLRNNDHLVESTEYCGEYYGTPAKYMTTRKVNYIAVVTPAGLRKLKREADYRSINFLSVFIKVDETSRIVKYLDRGGTLEEGYQRIVTDRGLFEGIESEVDLVIKNDGFEKSVEEVSAEFINFFNTVI